MKELNKVCATDQSCTDQKHTNEVYQKNGDTASLMIWFLRAVKAKLELLAIQDCEGERMILTNTSLHLTGKVPEIANALGLCPQREYFANDYDKVSFDYLGIEIFQLVKRHE